MNGAHGPQPQPQTEVVDACPACGQARADAPTYSDVRDVLGGTPGSWSLYTCSRCRSLFLHPRPVGQGLSDAYRTYYTHHEPAPAVPQGDALVSRLIRGYLSHRFGAKSVSSDSIGYPFFRAIPPLRQQLDYFFRHLPARSGRLLDVGCGNGDFGRRAAVAGWDVTGVEPDQEAASRARSAGLSVHVGSFDSFLGAHRFDAITLSHVIEHVPDPAKALQKARELLVPGGSLWIATPNVAGPGRRWYGIDWRGLEPPRHTVVFTAQALRELLAAQGFVDIRFRRRGRGARYILDQSLMTARARHRSIGRLPTWIVDVLGSISRFASEELVVTATAPR